jgi:hypothetical protein
LARVVAVAAATTLLLILGLQLLLLFFLLKRRVAFPSQRINATVLSYNSQKLTQNNAVVVQQKEMDGWELNPRPQEHKKV